MAGELNLCYALSTAGSQPISEVARVHDEGAAQGGRPNKHKNGAKGRWFQLYWPHVRFRSRPKSVLSASIRISNGGELMEQDMLLNTHRTTT